MNRMKKLTSVLLALVMVMVLGLATTAMAAEGANTGKNGKITVDKTIEGKTYTIYQIFELESYSDVTAAGGNYSYKVNPDWRTFFETAKFGASEGNQGTPYVVLDADGYITENNLNDTTVKQFAAAAKEWLENSSIENQGQKIADNTGSVAFENIPLGYYLVDSTTGALCSLDTTASEAVVTEKNGVPTNEKKVEENGTYGETNDAKIGDTVNFESTITAQAGAESYVYHDTMSDGLTFDSTSVKVTLNDVEIDSSNYSLVTKTEKAENDSDDVELLEDGCTFEVRFTDTFCNTLQADDKIVITYSATLNENAIVAGNGNTNESELTYGNNNRTEKSKTTTYTWKVNVFKYTKDANSVKQALANAKFVLSTDTNTDLTDENNTVIRFVSLGNNKYRVATTDDTENIVYEIETDATGEFELQGLDSGTYYLTETEAPKGYNQLTAPTVIKIIGTKDATDDAEAGTVQVEQTAQDGSKNFVDADEDKVEVENRTGPELPSTGGIGTTIFYAVGGVLVLAAVVLLVTKKRMSSRG